MKKLFTLLFTFCVCIFCNGQNLVLNPSLENYIVCPGFGQFSSTYINDWDKPSYGSTDYYHYNCPGIVPTQQLPHGGNAYAGIIGYNYGQEYREYMTGTLTAPLIPGATYYCEFYVSLNDGYIQAIKELGAYFSSTIPGPYTNTLHIPVTPQILNTVNLLDDTSSWMRISGYFLATGGEEYITIGNFNNDTNTTIVQVGSVGSYGSYYFVDDVWVSLSEGTGIEETIQEGLKIFPNPVSEKLIVTAKTKINSLRLMNAFGEIVFVESPNSINETIDLSAQPAGIYFIEISTGEKIFRKRIIRQ